MTAIKIQSISTTEISVRSPYNPEFVKKARNMGGKWQAPTWVFSRQLENEVKQACLEIYGSDGTQNAETVAVTLTIKVDIYVAGGPIIICGRPVVSAFGRDSGARIGEGVALISGTAGSGGSVKHWRTTLSAGSVLKIIDVPRRAAEAEYQKYNDLYSTFEIDGIKK